MKINRVLPTLFAAAALALTGAASTAQACQPNSQPSSAARSQYRAPKLKMKLAAFMAGVKTQNMEGTRAADGNPSAEPSMAGLWQVALVNGNDVEDAGLEMFGMGGVHVLNDPSPILEGNVCLGAWTQTAPLTYVVNHPAYIYDDKGEEVIGVAAIYEKIVLDNGGDSFKAQIKVVAKDLMGNVIGGFEGQKVGKRVIASDAPFK